MIRSADREVIRRQALLQRLGGEFLFLCDRCMFRRTFTTEQGAVNSAAAHLAGVHRIRLTLGKAS